MNLVRLGTISPAAHFLNCVHIGRSQTIAASWGFKSFFWKTLRKLTEGVEDFELTNIGRSHIEVL